MSIDPRDQAKEVLRAAESLSAEMTSLVARRHQVGAVAVIRAKDLRMRAKALGATIERMLAFETAMELAIEERLGREPADGELITDADVVRSGELIRLYPLRQTGN